MIQVTGVLVLCYITFAICRYKVYSWYMHSRYIVDIESEKILLLSKFPGMNYLLILCYQNVRKYYWPRGHGHFLIIYGRDTVRYLRQYIFFLDNVLFKILEKLLRIGTPRKYLLLL